MELHSQDQPQSMYRVQVKCHLSFYPSVVGTVPLVSGRDRPIELYGSSTTETQTHLLLPDTQSSVYRLNLRLCIFDVPIPGY